jgi:hypothetical protein
MHEVHNDILENGKTSQFRLKTLFVVVTCVAVFCALLRPGPKSMRERWSEAASAKTEQTLIDEFGPPQPVRTDIDERLKEIKRDFMPANARWLQWWDPSDPQRFFAAVVVDGKVLHKFDVHIHDDGREIKIGHWPIEDNL